MDSRWANFILNRFLASSWRSPSSMPATTASTESSNQTGWKIGQTGQSSTTKLLDSYQKAFTGLSSKKQNKSGWTWSFEKIFKWYFFVQIYRCHPPDLTLIQAPTPPRLGVCPGHQSPVKWTILLQRMGQAVERVSPLKHLLTQQQENWYQITTRLWYIIEIVRLFSFYF